MKQRIYQFRKHHSLIQRLVIEKKLYDINNNEISFDGERIDFGIYDKCRHLLLDRHLFNFKPKKYGKE